MTLSRSFAKLQGTTEEPTTPIIFARWKKEADPLATPQVPGSRRRVWTAEVQQYVV